MSFTSSEIQKKLERGAFSIHIARKRIEALKAEIAGHEEQMYDTARSLYDNEGLVEAAIAMAQMSIPALEMRASKLVAETSQSSQNSVTGGQPPAHLIDIDPSVSVVPPVVDGDGDVTEEDVVVVEPVTDGIGLAKLYAEEFFGVEVPASQIDFAREIKHEAAVSVKQNTKNNNYASDRGKNAWRKALFTRARAEYLKNGVPTGGANLTPEVAAPEEAVVEIIPQAEPVIVDTVEQSSSHDAAYHQDAEIDEVSEIEEADDVVEPVAIDVNDETAAGEAGEPQTADLDDVGEVADEDRQWSPETGDAFASAVSEESSEPATTGFADIPFFDEPETDAAVAEDHSVEAPNEAVSTVSDDHTLSIGDTFFADDDVPVLDPISFDDEVSDHSDDADITPADEPEDIDIPDFDPNAELFDENTSETPVVDTPSAPHDEPVAVEASSSALVEEPIVEATRQPSPEASRRAVPISSIPAHQRPGAPRHQAAAPARPQPGGTPGRVVTLPGPRPVPPTSQQTATPAASPSSVSTMAPAPSAPSRAAPARTAPVRTGETPSRTHGYGANVPAPPGLDEAIRERDAAAAKAAAPVTSTPSVPARPGAAPVRPVPGAPRGPVFTKPSFGR